jgi:hypothetical protein
MSFVEQYLAEARQVIERLDSKMTFVNLLVDTRSRKGRLFVLGVGSSAANASQAVNDFRKIAGIEALCLDRQRLRADGSSQRRRLGQRVPGLLVEAAARHAIDLRASVMIGDR